MCEFTTEFLQNMNFFKNMIFNSCTVFYYMEVPYITYLLLSYPGHRLYFTVNIYSRGIALYINL